MNTIIGVLERAKRKIIYHIEHIALSILIIGWIILEYGNLIGWPLSSRGIIGAVLISGGCYTLTWVRKNEKVFLFFSGFISALLIILVVFKLKGMW